MIQFNLLPEVKVQYLKVQALKRLVIIFSSLISGLAILIFLVLTGYVYIIQAQSLKSLNTSIQISKAKLNGNANLNKILTIQNQLETIPNLELQKPISSRVFKYMTQLTPVNASISNLSIDFTKHTITIAGSATDLLTVNQYVDTLKFTSYSTQNSQSGNQTKAFSDVVLSSFGYSQNNTNNKPASFTINLDYDPIIFSSAHKITLNVPPITTTRSILDQPKDLFQKSNNNSGI